MFFPFKKKDDGKISLCDRTHEKSGLLKSFIEKKCKFDSIDLLHTQKMLPVWPNFHQHCCYQTDKNYNEFSECLACDQTPKYGHEWMNEEFTTSVSNFN